ncbi:MAG: HlyC/CorC family transporter [Deltaproteobacteria bacterium]|nr:HlyC/CorC family transporter [Deltaproteobacteria bacterium]
MVSGSDIVILFILFLLSGFFSSAEAALLSLSDLHLHKMKADKYPFLNPVVKLLENPRRLLITVVTSNEAVNISISILAASLFIGLFGAPGQWISIVVTSTVLFLAGEAIPKTFGVTYPMQISAAVSPLMLAVSRLEFPIVAALEKAPGLLLRKLDRRKTRDEDVLMEDEFKHLIDAGSLEGVVDESQKELIKTIFESGDRPVTDIMIPRVDMFCLDVNGAPSDIVREIVRGRYERVPVYRNDRDNIIGILLARDLLGDTLGIGKSGSLANLLARPYFVPEEKTINALLRDFQEKSIQIAVVVDEYGGVSGLATLEDILAHLFEEAYHSDALTDCNCDVLDERTMIVPGRMPIGQVNDLTHAALPEEEFDTIGGFVLHLFGKVPERGEAVEFDGLRFRVENVGKTRIQKIRIEQEKPTPAVTPS